MSFTLCARERACVCVCVCVCVRERECVFVCFREEIEIVKLRFVNGWQKKKKRKNREILEH